MKNNKTNTSFSPNQRKPRRGDQGAEGENPQAEVRAGIGIGDHPIEQPAAPRQRCDVTTRIGGRQLRREQEKRHLLLQSHLVQLRRDYDVTERGRR